MSDDMASTSLRRFSASLVVSDWTSRRDELGDAVDQLGDVVAEQPGDLVARGVGVLERIVQQAGDDRRGVEPHLGQDAGDLDRMGEIGVARGAQLGAVLLQAVDIGAVQHVLVRVRIVGLHALDEFKLTNHGNRPLYGDDCAHSTLNARMAGAQPNWRQRAGLLGDVVFLGHRQGLGLGGLRAALGQRRRQLLLELGHLVDLLGLVDVGVLLHARDQLSLRTAWSSLFSAISRSATTGFLSRSRSIGDLAAARDVARALGGVA